MSATGTWSLTMKTPVGDQTSALTVVQDGAALSGVLAGAGDSVSIKDGAVSGDTISFKADVKKPMPITVSFMLTLSGDSISGTAKPGMFPDMPVTGSRAA